MYSVSTHKPPSSKKIIHKHFIGLEKKGTALLIHNVGTFCSSPKIWSVNYYVVYWYLSNISLTPLHVVFQRATVRNVTSITRHKRVA
jgi:hypothetical protein